MEINDLEIYRLAREIGKLSWEIYETLSYQDKKLFGDQWISSVDSIGANIAEGFGRFHYLDKNKFNYNARGSLLESIHWLEVMYERNKMKEEKFNLFMGKSVLLRKKLNNFITSTKGQTKK